jgi:hypothetical protein
MDLMLIRSSPLGRKFSGLATWERAIAVGGAARSGGQPGEKYFCDRSLLTFR